MKDELNINLDIKKNKDIIQFKNKGLIDVIKNLEDILETLNKGLGKFGRNYDNNIEK